MNDLKLKIIKLFYNRRKRKFYEKDFGFKYAFKFHHLDPRLAPFAISELISEGILEKVGDIHRLTVAGKSYAIWISTRKPGFS